MVGNQVDERLEIGRCCDIFQRTGDPLPVEAPVGKRYRGYGSCRDIGRNGPLGQNTDAETGFDQADDGFGQRHFGKAFWMDAGRIEKGVEKRIILRAVEDDMLIGEICRLKRLAFGVYKDLVDDRDL